MPLLLDKLFTRRVEVASEVDAWGGFAMVPFDGVAEMVWLAQLLLTWVLTVVGFSDVGLDLWRLDNSDMAVFIFTPG